MLMKVDRSFHSRLDDKSKLIMSRVLAGEASRPRNGMPSYSGSHTICCCAMVPIVPSEHISIVMLQFYYHVFLFYWGLVGQFAVGKQLKPNSPSALKENTKLVQIALVRIELY